jgi:hypothetical protein
MVATHPLKLNPEDFKMNRQNRRQVRVKGFRPGNIPYYKTPLKDVVICGGLAYQVKSRDERGIVDEFYPRTWLRLKVLRFRLWLYTFTMVPLKLKHFFIQKKIIWLELRVKVMELKMRLLK